MDKKKLLIVAHAPSPNLMKLRDAVLLGTQHPDIENIAVSILNPLETKPEDVLATDAIILGTPENLGYMSGALKDFFDRIYYPCLEKKQGLPYALYVRGMYDGTGTVRAIETIVTGLRWEAACEPLICRGEFRREFLDNCQELGATVAAGLDAGIF